MRMPDIKTVFTDLGATGAKVIMERSVYDPWFQKLLESGAIEKLKNQPVIIQALFGLGIATLGSILTKNIPSGSAAGKFLEEVVEDFPAEAIRRYVNGGKVKTVGGGGVFLNSFLNTVAELPDDQLGELLRKLKEGFKKMDPEKREKMFEFVTLLTPDKLAEFARMSNEELANIISSGEKPTSDTKQSLWDAIEKIGKGISGGWDKAGKNLDGIANKIDEDRIARRERRSGRKKKRKQ